MTQSSDDSDKSDNINIYLQTANVRAPASDHNLHQFLLLANCSSSDKSSPLHSLQATGSQQCYTCGCHFPRLVKFYGEEQKLGTKRAVREWMELGRPGARAGVMCVVMLSGECGGGEAGHNCETLYNVQTNLRRSRMTNLMGGHQTLSSSGDARHLPGKQSTIPAPRLTFC